MTLDEYTDLVDQAIFEFDELLMCAEDEGDGDYELSELLPIYEQLSGELRKLHADIVGGAHIFADGSDLPFMSLARQWKRRIPCAGLLEKLNVYHKSGL